MIQRLKIGDQLKETIRSSGDTHREYLPNACMHTRAYEAIHPSKVQVLFEECTASTI